MWALALLLVLWVARRIPGLRLVVSLASWIVLGGLLLIVFGQRARFDPYLQRAAEYLSLDRQQVTGEEVRIQMAQDGHFWARATIDGVERRLLIDSGATVTALSTGTAQAAGLELNDELLPVILRTANGTVRAQTSEIAELRLGNIVARELAVVVSPGLGNTDILGMNFLSRLKSWRVEGRTLILVPHHPQAAAR